MFIAESQAVAKLSAEEVQLLTDSSSFNWPSLLSSVPFTIAIMADVMISASGTQDFSLAENLSEKGKMYIEYPESFSTTLLAISQSTYHAFSKAHCNMREINVHAKTIPCKIQEIFEILKEDAETIVGCLPILTEAIRLAAQKSTELSNEVVKGFDETEKFIEQVLLACSQTKSSTEEKQRENKARKQILDKKEAAMKEDLENAQQRISDLDKQIEKDQEDVKNAIDSFPIGWEMCLMNCLEQVVNPLTLLSLSGGK